MCFPFVYTVVWPRLFLTKSEVITARTPNAHGFGTDHGKNGWRFDYSPLVRLRILQLECLKHFVACHFPNLGVAQELDVFAHLHTSREIARHTFREIVAADHECNVTMRPHDFMLPGNRAAVIQGVRAAGL